MLDSIREGAKKPWMKAIIFIIVFSFIFAGYFTAAFFLGDQNAVVTVNGKSVSQNEFQVAYENVKQSRAEYYQNNVKTDEDERNFRENVLQQVISRKLIEHSTENFGLRLSTAALRDVIQNNPSYQEDGKYSSYLVDRIIQQAGISRNQFKQMIETQEVVGQLSDGLLNSEFVLDYELKNLHQTVNQKRSGKALVVSVEKFLDKVQIDEAQFEQYYQQNIEQFRVEEMVSVEYVELKAEDLENRIELTEDEIMSFYQNNSAIYRSEEERQYSHILILSDSGDDEALQKAQSISQRIKQGEDFSAIAQTESDDIPTRETGGDLGVLPKGSLEEAAELAVEKLGKVGDVTEPVKIEDGYQILKLTNIIEGEVVPLDVARNDVVAELKQQRASELYFSQIEVLKDKSFEIADSLVETAEATGIELKTSPLFGKSGGAGIFSDPRIIEAAFSSEVIDGRLNSAPLEISEKQVVVLRINSHQPSHTKPLEDVKSQVELMLKQSGARDLARQFSEQLIEKLKSSGDISEEMKEQELQWVELNQVQLNNANLSYSANQMFFRMLLPETELAVYDLVEEFQSFTLLSLTSVEKGNWDEVDASSRQQGKAFMSNYFSNALYSAYRNHLRKQAEIRRNLALQE